MTKNINLKSILDSGYYKILSCDREQITPDGEVMRIRFTNAAAIPTHFTGEIELLPGRNWAIRKLSLDVSATIAGIPTSKNNKTSLKSTTFVEYAEDKDGIPIPKSVRVEGGKEGPSTFTFDEFIPGAEAPEAEFTPKFYGLPDVTSPAADPQGGSLVYWLVGLASLAMVASVILRRRVALS
jgi:hypothetical protein